MFLINNKYNFNFFFFKKLFFFRLDYIFCKLFFYFSRTDIKYLFLKNLYFFFFKFFFWKIIFSNFYFLKKFFLKKYFFWIPIYYENNYFLIINKPFNILIHSNNIFLNNTLINYFLYFYGKKSFLIFRFGVINRLDKDTTGLMIFFKNVYFYINYLNSFCNGFVNKYYIVYVFGKIFYFFFDIFFFLNFKKFNFSKKKSNSLTKFLSFINFKFFNYFISFLKINLFSGRTHQIRIHLNYLKKYIICDSIYNNFNKNVFFYYLKRHCIHLYLLDFFFFNNKKIFFIEIYNDMFFFFKFLKIF